MKSTSGSHDTNRAPGLAYCRSVGVIAYIPICPACMVSWMSSHYGKADRDKEKEKNRGGAVKYYVRGTGYFYSCDMGSRNTTYTHSNIKHYIIP